MKPSGALNKLRQIRAQAGRQKETSHAPIRLSNLPEPLAKEARRIMDLIYWGDLTDPDKPSTPQPVEEKDKIDGKSR